MGGETTDALMRDSSAVLPPNPYGERGFVSEALLAPEQAIIAYFARAQLAPPGIESVPLDSAGGRVLASDAVAREDYPTHVRSTMDGFAILAAGGTQRKIVGEIRMGQAPPRAIGAGETLRIPTGGALPEGADAVIPIEDVDERDGTILLRSSVATGENLIPRASDVRAGECALQCGRRLGAPELGLLATLGYAQVDVFKRPRFGVISTGDELVDVDAPLQLGQVRDSNRYAIAASLRAMGAEALHLPRVDDDPEALRRALAGALEQCDGIVLTGGSSVGERDFTPRIVGELGAPGPIVHGIRVKPGKPTLLAAIGGKPILGLPGNPAAALMILEAVARPIVTACAGEASVRYASIAATASQPFAGREGWTWFVPARLTLVAGKVLAEPLRLRSALVSLLARAAGYVTLTETHPRIEAGEMVQVTPFSGGGAPIEHAR